MWPASQALQVAPVNPVEQVHVQPVLSAFNTTDPAWLLQCVASVHFGIGVHVGLATKPVAQTLQVSPVNPVEQVQSHVVFAALDVTESACPLHCPAVVHSVHVG